MNGKAGTAGLRVPVLVALFTVAPLIEAVRCSSLSSLLGGDVWWHLSSGLWILRTHSLPHSGLFTQAASNPWAAVSWLYEMKLAVFYQLFGLRAIPIFAMSCKMGLAVITFLLAGGWWRNFWPAVGVSAVAQYILGSVAPTPVYASILFFGIELLLQLEIRRAPGSAGAPARIPRVAWLLPPLFLVWGNVDVHFVDGLAMLLVFLPAQIRQRFTSSFESKLAALPSQDIEHSSEDEPSAQPAPQGRPSLAQRFSAGTDASHPASPGGTAQSALLPGFALIAVLCFATTLITPYFVQPYRAFFASVFNSANAYLPDFKAPGFRQPQDYVLLLLVMSAFLALGLRRSRDLFLIAILVIASALSFYSQRDVWLAVIVATAVMGEMLNTSYSVSARDAAQQPSPVKTLSIAFAATIVIIVVGAATLTPRSQSALLAKSAQSYPVEAGNYIRSRHLPQPIFNAFEWGGFLTHYLPEYPVAIDGRTDLYGDDFVVQYSKAMSAEIRYTDFTPLANAQTLLLPRSAIMAGALSTLPGYRMVYTDNVAVVIVKD